MFISSREHLPLYSLIILLISFIHSVFPSLLWLWVVLGRLGHHPYAEEENFPSSTCCYFPVAVGLTGDCVREGKWIWDETR